MCGAFSGCPDGTASRNACPTVRGVTLARPSAASTAFDVISYRTPAASRYQDPSPTACTSAAAPAGSARAPALLPASSVTRACNELLDDPAARKREHTVH